MGIRAGYRVRRSDGVLGEVLEVRPAQEGEEPCFAEVAWRDGVTRTELLRDIESAPPPSRFSDWGPETLKVVRRGSKSP